MFRGTFQKKLLTVLYSGGSNPLEIWDIQVKNGWTRRVKDEELGNIVFEIAGTNVATAYIVSPPDPRGSLGVSLPFITMILKNLKRYFTFEIQILDDKQMRRRFRFSNYQSATKVRPFTCSVPLALKPGWNQMQLNLANFTMRAYGTNYMETQRVQVHANCRIRRVYFSDRLYGEEELPREYRVYLDVRTPKVLPPVEKVASILKQPSAPEKQPTPVPTPPIQEDQETLVTQTSYKSIPKPSASDKSVSEKRSSKILHQEKSLSNISFQKQPSSLKSIGTVEFEPQTEKETRDSFISKITQKSKTSQATLVSNVTAGVIAESVYESNSGRLGPDVMEQLEIEQAAESNTEDETSPRTKTLTESEYDESEPNFGSDVEDIEELSP